VDRVAAGQVLAGEPLLEPKLAPKNTGRGLAALIPEESAHSSDPTPKRPRAPARHPISIEPVLLRLFSPLANTLRGPLAKSISTPSTPSSEVPDMRPMYNSDMLY
jgi:hypothetical protein